MGLRANQQSCEQNGKITEVEHNILFWREKHYSLRGVERCMHRKYFHELSRAVFSPDVALSCGHSINNMDDI
jgi:hypothetical protein